MEAALTEMYLAGVSVRRVEDITQAMWGTRVSASTVSDLHQKIYGKINEWRERPLMSEFPYVFLDGLWLKRSWGSEVRLNSRTKTHPPQTRATHLKRLDRNCAPENLWLPDFALGSPIEFYRFSGTSFTQVTSA